MLDPENRRFLRDALRPPDGYLFDRAISTTFSLDLVALLTLPVAFTAFNWEDEQGQPTSDPLALLEALRRHARRIHLFCEAGQIKVPTNCSLLFSYLEGCVLEAVAPKGGAFHPKVTVLRFIAGPAPSEEPDADLASAAVRYRVLCSSRNLTFDRCWDTLLVLDGVLKDSRVRAFSRNRPLSEFLAALPGMALVSPAEETRHHLEQMADEVLRTEFEVPEGYTDFNFVPLGLEAKGAWPFDTRIDRLLVVSPFVSEGLLRRIGPHAVKRYLISREEALDELKPEAIDSFTSCYHLIDSAVPVAEEHPASAEQDRPEFRDGVQKFHSDGANELAGLHAKLFVADAGHGCSLWTGSANATTAAFEKNVEFLVELRGSRYKCGVEPILERSAANGKKDGAVKFADLLQPYHRTVDPEVDHVRQMLGEKLEEARRTIARAGLTASITPIADHEGPAYKVELSKPRPAPWPAEVSVRCRPVSLGVEAAISIDASGNPVLATFDRVSFEALTAFFAFELTAAHGDTVCNCGFVLNVPLQGTPEQRENRLMLCLLSNRERLLRYLLMLLAGDDHMNALTAHLPTGFGGENGECGRGAGLPLLEPLLQTLDRQPERLDQIARLIQDLRDTPEGEALIPQEFLSVWEPVWEARRRFIT